MCGEYPVLISTKANSTGQQLSGEAHELWCYGGLECRSMCHAVEHLYPYIPGTSS